MALAMAHPAKFSSAVEMALKDGEQFVFKDILPEQVVGLEDLPKRVTYVQMSGGLDGVRKLIVDQVRKGLDVDGTHS